MHRAASLLFGALLVVGAVGLGGCSSVSAEVAKPSQPAPPSNSVATAPAGVPQDILTGSKDWAPTVMLAKGEDYWPVSVDWFLEFSELRSADGTKAGPPTTRSMIASEPTRWAEPFTRYLIVPYGEASDAWFMGGMSYPEQAGKWPAYIGLAKVTVDDSDYDFLIVRYATLYSYNTLSNDKNSNQHFGDWERVSVVLKRGKTRFNAPWTFFAVITNAHGDYTKTVTEPEWNAAGRPVVHAARYAHGTWPGHSTDWNMDTVSHGTAWDMSKTPNEIATYEEYRFPSGASFESEAALAASLKSAGGNSSRTVVYWAPWASYQGRWGQSRKIDGKASTANSPMADVGVSYELYELAKLPFE